MLDNQNPSPPADAKTPRCPVAHGLEFDPLAVNQLADPYPWLARAQREQPVFHLPAYNVWVITRHQDAGRRGASPGGAWARATVTR